VKIDQEEVVIEVSEVELEEEDLEPQEEKEQKKLNKLKKFNKNDLVFINIHNFLKTLIFCKNIFNITFLIIFL
tara:strand:+ start:435 stop:653 length:219 start_codon:yes stop_codon:yes gene_type:complete